MCELKNDHGAVEHHAPFVAFLGVGRACTIDAGRIAEECAVLLGASAIIKLSQSDRFVVQIDGRGYAVAQMSFPIPKQDLATAVRTSYAWREAVDAVSAAQAHCVVSALRIPTKFEEAIEQAADITALVAAIIDQVNATFVYWEAGDTLTDPRQFRERASRMLPDRTPPILSWMKFELVTQDGEANRLYGTRTAGLTAFVGYEIDILPILGRPVDAMRVSVAIASYIMREGDVLVDGDSVIVDKSHSASIKFTHGAGGEKIAVATVAFRRTE